jgi:hypothetical protein
MKIQTWQYDFEQGHDVVITVAEFPFDSKNYLSKESVAKAFHKKLCELAERMGQNPKNVMLWAPDVAATSMTRYAAWTICWEEGPFEWALFASGTMEYGPWGYAEPYNSFILTFTA